MKISTTELNCKLEAIRLLVTAYNQALQQMGKSNADLDTAERLALLDVAVASVWGYNNSVSKRVMGVYGFVVDWILHDVTD